MNSNQKPINVQKRDEFGELFEEAVGSFSILKSTPEMPHEPPSEARLTCRGGLSENGDGEKGQGPRGEADIHLGGLSILDKKAKDFGVPPAAKRMSELVGDAPELANRKAPYYYVQQEKPHHRVFLELAAKGYAVKEIAEMTGFTPVCVNNILRQPHTQQFLVNEIRDIYSVDEEVVMVIKDNAVAAVQTLADIVKSPLHKGSDRIAAANALLDRRYGKPNQPINRGTDIDLNTLTDDELAAMLPTQATGTGVCL